MEIINSLPKIIDAVQEELAQIKYSKRNVTLFEGKLITKKLDKYIYKFELPEGVFIQVEEISIVINKNAIEGDVLSVDNQFITIQVKEDFGKIIPQLTVEWFSDLIPRKIIERLSKIKDNPSSFNLALTDLLFYPNKSNIVRNSPIQCEMDKSRNPEQEKAILGSLNNKISYIWGPPGTGKTTTVGFIIYNLIKNGKRVLFATNTNRAVDVTVRQVISAYKTFQKEFIDDLTRYGKPYILNDTDLDSVFFDNQIEKIKSELTEKIKDKVELLQDYNYLKTLLNKNKILLEQLNRLKAQIKENENSLSTNLNEVRNLDIKIKNYNNVGLLERLARSFLGNTLGELNVEFNEKKTSAKTLKSDLEETRIEYAGLVNNSSINNDDLIKFDLLKIEVHKFGGEEKLKNFIEESLNIDDASILKTKKFIGATLAKTVTNDVFFDLNCDTLIIDEASMVNLPYLAILSSLVKDSIVIVGDPQQLPPITQVKSSNAKNWLEKDIFMYASQSIDVEGLFKWQNTNPEFVFFLNTQYRMTGKLSHFISELFYNNLLKNGNHTNIGELSGTCFIDTTTLNPQINLLPGKKSYAPYNIVHTQSIINILKYLALNNLFHPDEIGIVVPFKASAIWIKKELRKEGLNLVEVGTVHTFQGREKEFIIFDTVMSNVNFTVRPFDEALTNGDVMRLLNVALSRPKQLLFVVANYKHFSDQYKNKFILKVLTKLKENSDLNSNFDNSASTFDELTIEEQNQLTSNYLVEDETTDITGKKENIEKRNEEIVKEETTSQGGTNLDEKLIVKELQKLGKKISALRFEINNLSSRTIHEPLFKPSIESEEITYSLPSFFVANKEDFKIWIDKMYKYFYESSGGKNPNKFVTDLTNDKYKVRYDINKLRNDFYHDAAVQVHSEEFKNKVHFIYKSYVGKNYPTKNNEWSNMQIGIMNKIVEWLEEIQNFISK